MEGIITALWLLVGLKLGLSSIVSSFTTLLTVLIAPFYSPGKTSNVPCMDASFLFVLVPNGMNARSPSWTLAIFGGAGGFFLWIFTILSHNILDGIESSIIPFFLAMCHLRKWFVLKQCLMIMHFFCQYLFLDVVIGFNVRNRASKCGSTFVCFSINNSLLHWICNEVSYTNKNTTIRILVRSLGKWLFANVFEGSQCLLFAMEYLLSWHEIFIVPSNRLIATFGE